MSDLLLADNHDEIVSQFTQMVDESEQSVMSIESELASLNEIADTIEAAGGITKTHAVALESMHPGILPRTAPVNSFTVIPSNTNLKVALEEIDKKKAGLIAAAVAAIALVIYKIWKWIAGKSDDVKEIGKSAVESAESVEKTEEQTKAALAKAAEVAEIKEEVNKAIKHNEGLQDKLAFIHEHYTEIVHLSMNASGKFISALNKTVGIMHTAPEACEELKSKLENYLNSLHSEMNSPQGLQEDKLEKLSATIGELYNRTYVILADTVNEINSAVIGMPSVSGIKAPDDKHSSQFVQYVNQQIQTTSRVLGDITHKLKQKSQSQLTITGGDISHLVNNVSKYRTQLKVMNNTLSTTLKQKEIEQLAEKFKESDYSKALENEPSQQTRNLIGFTTELDRGIANYSRAIGHILQIYLLTFHAGKKFTDSLLQYQEARKGVIKKSMGVLKSKNRQEHGDVIDAIMSIVKENN